MPKEYQKNPKRIPKEYPQNVRRVPKESQRMPEEYPKNPPKIKLYPWIYQKCHTNPNEKKRNEGFHIFRISFWWNVTLASHVSLPILRQGQERKLNSSQLQLNVEKPKPHKKSMKKIRIFTRFSPTLRQGQQLANFWPHTKKYENWEKIRTFVIFSPILRQEKITFESTSAQHVCSK